jgi:FkbM family methyltransferase
MSLLLEDIKTYLASLPLTTALRLAGARLALRLLDSRAAVSYSQFGEDRVLPLFIKSEQRGFYVDVGANDPIATSNTFWLYKKGWRGIVIDPNPELIRRHKRLRPRDVQVANLVSNCCDPLEFTIFKNHPFSSASAARVRDLRSKLRAIATITLRPRTLTEILDEQCCPETFDLLAIDVEGQDLQVLQSLDWKRYRPRMVVVEMPIYNLLLPQANEINNWMFTQGYCLCAFDGYNGYFRSSE